MVVPVSVPVLEQARWTGLWPVAAPRRPRGPGPGSRAVLPLL